MKIGINILYLIPDKVGGTETYARELIAELAKTEKLVLFCGKETAHTFKPNDHLEIIALPIYSKNRIARLLVEQILLPLYCLKSKTQVLLSLGYSAPFFHPGKSVVTIHDLNWHYHPEDFNALNLFMWKWMTKLSAKYSDHILTDSSASRESIIEVLKEKPLKVTSILHGTPSIIKTTPYKSTQPYIFTVLADYPHKNIVTLLAAFASISKSHPALELIVCGLGKQPSTKSNIKYLGYVSREELASLYAGASVFVFPSAYEGFGYPVLEAMSYATPVVSSNAFSLSEVVGDAGILVDPYDVTGYVKAVNSILDSSSVREDLIRRAKLRVSELQWTTTAKQTLNILKGLLK